MTDINPGCKGKHTTTVRYRLREGGYGNGTLVTILNDTGDDRVALSVGAYEADPHLLAWNESIRIGISLIAAGIRAWGRR